MTKLNTFLILIVLILQIYSVILIKGGPKCPVNTHSLSSVPSRPPKKTELSPDQEKVKAWADKYMDKK